MDFRKTLVVALTVVFGLSGVASASAGKQQRAGQVPTVEALLGGEYRSIKATGNSKITSLRLDFFMHSRFSGQSAKPTLSSSGGCNARSSKFLIRNGRLRTYGGFLGTLIGCSENPDPWLARAFNRGLKVWANGNRLILTRPNEGIRFVLRRVGPSRFGEAGLKTPAAEDLLGGEYQSISVAGNPKVKSLRLDFFMHSTNPDLPNEPTLVFAARCNTHGSKFRIVNGRLQTYGGFAGTARGCSINPDGWISSKLNKSLKVRTKGRQLILTRPNEGVRFVLKRVGPTRFG